MRRMPAASLGSLLLLIAAAASGDAASTGERVGMFNTTRLTTTNGAEIFQQICQGCHMADAKGATGAGRYPSLARDPALSSSLYMAITILEGRRNMPGFGAKYAGSFFFSPQPLSSEQVAAVINYVRGNFGNHYSGAITVAEVDKIYNSH